MIVEVDEITAALDEALALTDQPDHGYATAANTERRLLNQAVWERLIVDQKSVIEATKTELYRELDWWAHPAGEPTPALHEAPGTADEAQNDENPDHLLSGGRGSNVDLMVRLRGLEPPRGFPHTDLNRACLPISPQPRDRQVTKRRCSTALGQVPDHPAGAQPARPDTLCTRAAIV